MPPMSQKRVRDMVPKVLEGELITGRLDLLALFRGLDQLDLTPDEIPQALLGELFDLDGDFAEALAVLDEPARRFNVGAMLRDTQRALGRRHGTVVQFLKALAPRGLVPLEHETMRCRAALTLTDAYHSSPGKDPTSG